MSKIETLEKYGIKSNAVIFNGRLGLNPVLHFLMWNLILILAGVFMGWNIWGIE